MRSVSVTTAYGIASSDEFYAFSLDIFLLRLHKGRWVFMLSSYISFSGSVFIKDVEHCTCIFFHVAPFSNLSSGLSVYRSRFLIFCRVVIVCLLFCSSYFSCYPLYHLTTPLSSHRNLNDLETGLYFILRSSPSRCTQNDIDCIYVHGQLVLRRIFS